MSEGESDESRVAAVVKSTFQLATDMTVTAATTSADVDGWDSLSHSILIMRIEEEFEIELPVDRVYDLKDVGELVQLVSETRRRSA